MMVGMVGVVEVAISLACCDMEKKGTGSFKWHIWRRDIQANWMMPAEKKRPAGQTVLTSGNIYSIVQWLTTFRST